MRAATKAGSEFRSFHGVTGSPGKRQKEGQEDQNDLKKTRGYFLKLFQSPQVLLAFLLVLLWATCRSINPP
jgi:hypothetical protein